MKSPKNAANPEQALRLAQLEISMLREQLAKALDDAKAGRGGALQTSSFVALKPSPAPLEPEGKRAPDEPPPALTFVPKGRRVLCVEDSEANFQLMEAILSEQPETELIWAENGRKGIELALARQPQVILLDLDLPDIHGSEVLAQLRSLAATAEIPVIIISADATSSQIERMLAAGARDYLTKPFEVRRFLLMLEEIFKQK